MPNIRIIHWNQEVPTLCDLEMNWKLRFTLYNFCKCLWSLESSCVTNPVACVLVIHILELIAIGILRSLVILSVWVLIICISAF